MVTQHGIKYAVHIITAHFGNLVAKVCECLIRRGPLTLLNITRYTELTSSQVKNSLLVLIQHNCVQAFILEQLGGFGEGSKFNTQYIVLVDNILHRVRFSKFLMIVSAELDNQCVELFEGLLQHGRLTVNQMLDRAKANERNGNSVVSNAVRGSLLKLVTAHYVERCPAPEPLLALPIEEEAPPKKRGAKSDKIIEKSETIEQRVLSAAVPWEGLRFAVIPNTESDAGAEKDENNSSTITVGEKRKHDAVEPNKENGAMDESIVLWRANVEEFMHHLRHKACIEIVRAHLDDGAVTVLSAMVEATRAAEKKVKTENSVPLSVNSIYEEVIKSEAGQKLTFDHVRASLGQLGSQFFVSAVDEAYSINFKSIVELGRNEEVESIVSKRHGKKEYRIFRLLSMSNRFLETDKISNDTLTEKKDTLNILYKLWKDDYLHMEKVVVTGSRQSQFMLWKVIKHTLWEHVLDEMFHAALNLSQRLAYELEKETELLNLPSDKRTGQLKDKFNRIKRVRSLLESSQMKLDDAILLFHDF
ncbi:RNA_pol_Rpc82 domain-containing protein/HTH_9 domain-containing protein [Cephalotus follicularis]|uniref:DNA-directed RNA polymerase III subunit RPC3 n=1 Tax=Cephalotus follicularis TaxID=3775 RepID=A0A1Q3CGF5_CEPFO|nr:RNA_pol_Rpc82 domain-containing protein/HTH_9 domain-containing protein [Cephalotus follicularis]